MASPTCFGLQRSSQVPTSSNRNVSDITIKLNIFVQSICYYQFHKQIMALKTKINQQNAQINSGLIYY